ncbi:exocyst complex component Sec3-domain-containing protein [Durotheca rogersii]|uniref:exocyst complex component Sec3-domain-containing protein n=1 Tax=Durotheca rogersii TaxID=419775 RepID=UPI00221EC632|nr:exocyst complex component Sec3-domain-containing protein [Durotheca rogersii]KAI5861404.1 exocyst complex component Sec3-domain-containing protein [Durotheca rogersii]
MDHPRQNGGNGFSRETSRAERFEEEKRRIVESCFNKKDVDGSILETYITHIRITEYASHPSSPPPPDARLQSEKPRVIIVAVRKSGRVRMHKSKENANGTFSIGKTWDLNDMTVIESFTAATVDLQKREWAGETGFVVNLGKPYYWQAQGDKEKKFFIASLIKIYGKYTGGNVPELRGFDPRELEQVLGSRRPPPSSQPGPSDSTSSLRSSPAPPPRSTATPPRIDPKPYRPDPVPSYSKPTPAHSNPNLAAAAGGILAHRPSQSPTSPARNLAPPNGTSSPGPGSDSIRAGNQAAALRRLAGNNRSQDSVAGSVATTKSSDDGASLPPRSRGGVAGPGALGRFGDPLEPPSQVELPDRKRPPMDPTRLKEPMDNDLVPAPLMSQAARREPPPRSTERMSPRKNSFVKRPDLGSPVTRLAAKLEPAADISRSPIREYNDAPPTLPVPAILAVPSAPVPQPSPTTPTPTTALAAPVTPATPPAESPVAESPAGEEESRPGLGPMIKSKKSHRDLAGSLWKAASAAAAFKPRPGGAGERLREAAQNKSSSNGADGITSVFTAPRRPEPIPEIPKDADLERKSADKGASVPEVKVTLPSSSRPSSLKASAKENQRKSQDITRLDDTTRRLITTGNDVKYLTTLGVDTTVLANKTTEFTRWLDHFGWVPGEQMRSCNFEEMKLDLDRELNKAQAGGWIVRFQEEDDRVEAIKKGLDVAIAECDELDNLLTLYSVELSTLSDDIAYIEAQGQGLQVQASNQKLLRKELESLLDTCAITSDDLQALSAAPLESVSSLEDVEAALVTLYKAMLKIDSSVSGSELRKSEDVNSSSQPSSLNTDYGKMRIVQEKKEMYRSESAAFLQRFGTFMSGQFDKACQEIKAAVEGALSKRVDAAHHDVGRNLLWCYSPLILYAREVDVEGWNRCMQAYQEKNLPLYKFRSKDIIDSWKRNARKPSGDEAELLFSTELEKQQEGTMATAKKLTVKRSQTLARSLRSPLGDGSRTNLDKVSDHRNLPYEVFAGMMDDLVPLVEIEQNFIVDFFHATTLETADFPDLVAATKPRDRRGGDLRRHRLMEPDRELARRVTRAMEAIFSFLEQDLQATIDWVLSQDPLQGIGVLSVLERKQLEMTQSNQDFLNNVLQKLHSNLESRFSKFVEGQIRAIEETKVKIKKRKGVISFMRVFPHFSTAVENMLSTADMNSSVRRTVDREYDRIIKTMFDSLKVIARENPATLTNSGADPEDKEALNYHILLIENMNHFYEELDTHGLEILEDWKEAAASEMTEHMSLYLNAVMRRPLGKLLEYLENIETQLVSGKSPTTVAAQPSNAKATFNKILSGYDGREVRKGVEALRKRVEKHFGDADDPSLSRGLVTRVLQECEKFYGEVEVRVSTVTTTVYSGDVLFEWPRADVKSAFSNTGR